MLARGEGAGLTAVKRCEEVAKAVWSGSKAARVGEANCTARRYRGRQGEEGRGRWI